jgi:acyl-CoA reductase-like NAD-dependent aldehyde dehydrogenase
MQARALMEPIPVRNPRSGRYDDAIVPLEPAALAARCAELRAAQFAWEACDVAGRVTALRAWRAAIAAGRDELLAALVLDTGRLAESTLEIDSVLAYIDRWCSRGPELLLCGPRRTSAVPFVTFETRLAPYPLVGVISPWNFPLLLSLIDALPALLAGCAVIVKPSEIAPRFIEPLRRSIAAVPALAGVLSLVAGAGPTGAALLEQVDLVCFTGSVATGRRVAEAAARRFIPAFLELGGKDPAIVLAGADLDRAAAAILWGGTVNCGHSCLSIERVYVEASVHDEFVELLVARASRLRLAYPGPGSGEIGPIIAERQAAVIAEHLADAYAGGAVARCGGAIEEHGGGLYCRPTVLTGVHHRMKVMREETFGPILPVMPAADADEAVTLANDSIPPASWPVACTPGPSASTMPA